ncbi:Proton pump-interactor 1, partial [Mucuna pruriens]
ESVAEPSNSAVESEAEPSNSAVESEAEPSNSAVESKAEPSNSAVESEAEPSNSAVESKAEPSNGAAESETKPSNVAVESEAEPSNGEVESEAEPSDGAVEREAEPSNGAVEREAEPSNGAVESEAVPSNGAVKSEAEPSNGAVESEAEPSDGVIQSESGPSVDVDEMKNNAVESKSEPSVHVYEIKNNAVNSEAEPSSGAVQSESESSVVSEIKNNTVESETEPSVDVSDKKTDAVESEAEPSVEGGPSVEGEGSNQGDEDSRPASDALDGQNMGSEVVKKPFYYLIRVPRYDDDEKIKDQITNALHQVEEKTKIRDDIRAESQTIKASCKDYNDEVKAAITADRAARDLLKSKRQEMDLVQSTLNRLNNAISVGDIDGKIRNMEHMIQHETLPLNEEKQLIRQIKQLKQNREELSSNMRKQDQSQQSLDPKDNIEEHFKLLKKEMEVLRNNVLKSDAATKAAKKKYSDECDKLNELLARFKAADVIRQETYVKLQTLKKQLHEKSKNFWEYRNAANKAQELAAGGRKEELQCFCVDQAERIMELWNKNDDFRRDYVRCNTRSTLRRLQTLDGRSLGPDEEPPVIPNAIIERASKNISTVSQSTLEQEKKSTSTESVNIKNESVLNVAVQRTERSQTTKAKKPTKPALLEKSLAHWGDESDEDKKEEPVRTKEEEELVLKAEKARKEEEEARLKEEEAKLKEKRRQEEIEKAKEALQRKKRNAEKAQQRAALKAQKEAEQKEKAREKRAKKKERRKAASTADTAENTEQESAPISETLTRSMEEFDQSENPAEVTKKPQKPSQFARQTKTKSIPLALRNRGKRRIQPWMWILVAVIVAVALFYVGNSSTLRSSLEGFAWDQTLAQECDSLLVVHHVSNRIIREYHGYSPS